MKTKKLDRDKVHVITLGCAKNLVDSEQIVTQLHHNDFEVTHNEEQYEDANIVIVNTCGFIDLAKEESINTILSCAEAKKAGEIEKLYVTGCLSQRYKDDLEDEIPEVDAFFGTMELPGLMAVLNANYKHELIGERWISTPKHYAYVKISEGCNRTCSFCAIPLMRGKHVSKSIDDLVVEAKNLAKIGVKEIMLIAQESTYYGLDIYKRRALPELLEALNGVEGIEWIRIHYAYPSKFPIEVIEKMHTLPKVCNYIDIPLQHASNTVLDRMKRQITQEETRALITQMRSICPDIAIRTTMLVGFPGESDEEFETLCDFVKEMRFERLGVFQYSHEENTSAHELEDDVDPEVKAERANELMDIQRDISYDLNQAKIGQTLKVLIDKKESNFWVGRSEYDSVEVDNEILIDAEKYFARVGDFMMVEIIDADSFDLYGKPIDQKPLT